MLERLEDFALFFVGSAFGGVVIQFTATCTGCLCRQSCQKLGFALSSGAVDGLWGARVRGPNIGTKIHSLFPRTSIQTAKITGTAIDLQSIDLFASVGLHALDLHDPIFENLGYIFGFLRLSQRLSMQVALVKIFNIVLRVTVIRIKVFLGDQGCHP